MWNHFENQGKGGDQGIKLGCPLELPTKQMNPPSCYFRPELTTSGGTNLIASAACLLESTKKSNKRKLRCHYSPLEHASRQSRWKFFYCCLVQLFWGPMKPTRLLCPRDSPGKNTGVGCHFLLWGIFLSQGLHLCLLHWQADSSLLSGLHNLFSFFFFTSETNHYI